MDEELENLRTEKEILKKCIQHMAATIAMQQEMHSKAVDLIENIAQIRFASTEMCISRLVWAQSL